MSALRFRRSLLSVMCTIVAATSAGAVDLVVEGTIDHLESSRISWFPELTVGDAIHLVYSIPNEAGLVSDTFGNDTLTVRSWQALNDGGSLTGSIFHADSHEHIISDGSRVAVQIKDNFASDGRRIDGLAFSSSSGILEIHDGRPYGSQFLDLVRLDWTRVTIQEDRDWIQGTTLLDVPTKPVSNGTFSIESNLGKITGTVSSVRNGLAILQAGDADQDSDFDQFDLVLVGVKK